MKMKKSIMSPEMEFEVALHGLLLWASIGFLLPLGILVIRVSHTVINRRSDGREASSTKLGLLFYFHIILQILSVLLCTAGAVMSIRSFENSFTNNHQRIGLALYLAIWIQTVLGFSKPQRGSRKRRAWYLLHWLVGTAISVVGIINVYLGLEAYRRKASKSVRTWVILFTAQITVMAVFYLLQDKWHYLQSQRGAIPCSGDEPIRPSHPASQPLDQESNPQRVVTDEKKYPKANALKNLLK